MADDVSKLATPLEQLQGAESNDACFVNRIELAGIERLIVTTPTPASQWLHKAFDQ